MHRQQVRKEILYGFWILVRLFLIEFSDLTCCIRLTSFSNYFLISRIAKKSIRANLTVIYSGTKQQIANRLFVSKDDIYPRNPESATGYFYNRHIKKNRKYKQGGHFQLILFSIS